MGMLSGTSSSGIHQALTRSAGHDPSGGRDKEAWYIAWIIDPRYRALVLVAALTGMRSGELVALRWDDPRFDQPLDDGAVRGPGRLRITRAISDPRRTGRGVEKGPRPRPASG